VGTNDDWVRYIVAPALVVATASAYATQYLTVEQAQRLMFGASARFDRRDLKFDQQAAREIERRSGVRVRLLEQPLWEVRENGARAGYFVVDEVIGKHELITYAVALNLDGRVKQIEILDYRENYGYEIRNAAWRAQFAGRSAADALKLDADIRNISGATLSCRHVTEGVRRLLAMYELLLRDR
jgi:hypothetical protein